MSDITLNIKYLREKAGYSRFQVAQLLSMTVDEYTAIEEGEVLPSMQTIVRLSHICRTTCDELIGFESPDEASAKKDMERFKEELEAKRKK